MLEGITEAELKRQGAAAETLRWALEPIVTKEFERALVALETAKTYDELLSARADIRTMRSLLKQLGIKANLVRE